MPTLNALSVGRDLRLLPLRNQILRSAGYAVHSQTDSRYAVRMFIDGDFDLVVLCHSIPVKERNAIIAAIKAEKPTTLVIVIKAYEDDPGIADGSVHSLDGAKALLECIEELLSRRKGVRHIFSLPQMQRSETLPQG